MKSFTAPKEGWRSLFERRNTFFGDWYVWGLATWPDV